MRASRAVLLFALAVPFACTSVCAAIEVHYQAVPLPPEVSLFTGFVGSPNGTGWLLGGTARGLWRGQLSNGQIATVPGVISEGQTDVYLSFDGKRMIDSVVQARDAMPYLRIGKAQNSIIFGKNRSVRDIYETNPYGGRTFICGDFYGVTLDNVAHQSAELGAGPNTSMDGSILYSAVDVDYDGNRTVGVYSFVSGVVTGNQNRCKLKTVFNTDPKYDIISVWKEASGAYLAHRWLQNPNATNRNTEVVRYSSDGQQMTVLVSTDGAQHPQHLAVSCCTRVVSDSLGKSFAWGYQSVDSTYHLMVVNTDGSIKEATAPFRRYMVPTMLVDKTFALVATGMAPDQLDTLVRVDLQTGSQAVMAAPGLLGTSGITLAAGGIDPNKAWVDNSGAVYFGVNKTIDRVLIATLTASLDTPVLDSLSNAVAPGSTVTLTGKNLVQSGAATVILVNGSPVAAASGPLSFTAPTAASSYTVQVQINMTGVTSKISNQIQLVVAIPPVSASLAADRTEIMAGESVQLIWQTTNATSVFIDSGIGKVSPSGTASVKPAATTTYTLTATGSGGAATESVTIKVREAEEPPVIASVTTAMFRSLERGLAPETFGTVFGTRLTGFKQTGDPPVPNVNIAQGIPFPTRLAGAQVRICDRLAPLYYAQTHSDNSSQINFLAPDGLPNGPCPLVVERYDASGVNLNSASQPVMITITDVSPTLLGVPDELPVFLQNLRQDPTGLTFVGPGGKTPIYGLQTAPAKGGDWVEVYATGLGATTPAVRAGTVPESDTLASVNAPVTAVLKYSDGSTDFMTVLHAVHAPQFPGEQQVALRFPTTVRPGTATLNLKVGTIDVDPIVVYLQ